MSMLFELRRITKDQANLLLSDPSDILHFLYGTEPYEPPRSLFQRLFGPKVQPKQQNPWNEPQEGTVLELEKNWHVIHYVLSRSAWETPLPQGYLLSGAEIGDIDVGYGPARLLEPNQVKEFLDYLKTLTLESFAAGVSSADLDENEIYGAYPDWGVEDINNLWEYIEELKPFLSEAVRNEECVIMYIY